MEFEQARHERDPETVSRLLVGGRGALEQALEKVSAHRSGERRVDREREE